MYSFYQSHSTILYNYNIYRCSSVCLFTSNDGGELRGKHRIDASNTGTKYFSSANIGFAHWFVLQGRICPHQSASVTTHARRLLIPQTDSVAKHSQAKASRKWHVLSPFTETSTAPQLVAFSDKIDCAQLRTAALQLKEADTKTQTGVHTVSMKRVETQTGPGFFIRMWIKSSLYSNVLSDSFVFHNTHHIIEKIKYANLRM